MDNFSQETETIQLTEYGHHLACELLEARVLTMPQARWNEITFNGKLEPTRDPTDIEALAILLAAEYVQMGEITQVQADAVSDKVLIALTAPEERA